MWAKTLAAVQVYSRTAERNSAMNSTRNLHFKYGIAEVGRVRSLSFGLGSVIELLVLIFFVFASNVFGVKLA